METTPLSLLTYTDLKKKIDNFEDELDLFSEFIFWWLQLRQNNLIMKLLTLVKECV